MPTAYAGRQAILLTLCAVFVGAGLVVASVGPALPDLARQNGRPLGDLGRVFVAIFGGGLLAQFLGGRTSDLYGRRIVLISSCALFGVGTMGLAVSTALPVTLATAVILGLGYGGCALAVNVLAAELSPQRRASTVNLVNMFYAGGAIAGPLIAALFLRRNDTALPALWIGSVLLLALAPCVARVIPRTEPTRGPDGPRAPAPRIASVFVVGYGIFLSLYVGSETSIGAWATVYLERSTSLQAAGAATATASFWLALCVGRMLAVLVGMRLSAERLLSVTLAGALVGGVVLCAAHHRVVVSIVALVILGLSFGPIYPTAIAIATGRFPHAAGAVTGRIQAVASLGGMALPWVLGLVLTRRGTFAFAFVMMLLAGAMWGVRWDVRRRERARAVPTVDA